MVHAAVYARISSDDGSALGVARQVEDCRKLAADLGWEVGGEYVDNDVSAYSGKRRAGYERMLADIADGSVDAVVVYHADRLTRRPIELEQFLEVVTAAGVRHVRFVAGGELDVGNGDGLLMLRMLGAVAANESASKSRRVRRKLDEVAAAGRPHGGKFRPFGFEPDKVTIRESEAVIVRDLAKRFIAGESLRSLTGWLDEQGVETVGGAKWRSSTVRAMLRSGRIAGLREHRGEVVGEAVWDAIISVEDRDRILAKMNDQAVSGRRTPRRYLLSGLCRCGRCGNKLYSAARVDTRRYVCSSGPDHDGCGRLTVVAAPLEELIVEAVLYRLDTPELAAALAGREALSDQAVELAERLGQDRQRLDDLARVYANGEITVREWMAARGPIEDRIETTGMRLARMDGDDAVRGLAGTGEQLRESWAGLNLTRQAAIVASVISHVVVHPTVGRARGFDPDRAEPVWKL